MPLFIRKYVSVGPFRFNLSKSGVGVSGGVKGFRLGLTGPRGHYVYMGRGGLYYRQQLNAPRSRAGRTGRTEFLGTAGPVSERPVRKPTQPPDDSGVGPYEDIQSADVSQMVDATSQDIVTEINRKLALRPLFPIALIVSALGFVVLIALSASGLLFLIWALIAIIGCGLSRYRDVVTKSVVVMYDIEPTMLGVQEQLQKAIGELASCARRWHITQEASIREKKYHAGASKAVIREPIAISSRGLPGLRSNVDIPALTAGKKMLAFTPERLLVLDKNRVGAVPYSDLEFEIKEEKLVDTEGVPSDSEVVGHTWRYVNKKGGPDRRFRNNQQLPIVRYEELHLTSTSGLNELFCFSKVGAAPLLKDAVVAMTTALDSIRSQPEN